jgi:hypothetical protein
MEQEMEQQLEMEQQQLESIEQELTNNKTLIYRK